MERDLLEKARTLRRDLHACPELGYQEHETRSFLFRYLSGLGLEPRAVGETGLVVDTAPGAPLVTALRADMDALPLEERADLPYRSRNEGCMHACGHDGHMAILAGTAEAILRHLPGINVRLIFQPAEEGGGGASAMIRGGALEGVPSIYGLHNWPRLPLGRLAVREGPVMASSVTMALRFQGLGGHASQPQDLVDPILAASHFVVAAQAIVSRMVHPLDPVVVSFGSIHGGTRGNVVPDEVRLEGTVRALSEDVQEQVRASLSRVADAAAASLGARATMMWEPLYPVTANHPDGARLVRQAAGRAALVEAVQEAPLPSMGSEDFGMYLREVPGALFFLGTGVGDDDPILHSQDYDFNDDALGTGIQTFLSLVELLAAVPRPSAPPSPRSVDP